MISRRLAGRAAGLLALLASLGSARALSGETIPMLPGPAPRQRANGFDVEAENDRCVGCHEDEAREWSGSMHANAFRDRVFLAAYALEPIAFCRGCHAPEADPAHEPDAAARAVGVGCVTCHVASGRVIGARPPASKAPHPVFVDARLATEDACANCHDFAFPTLPKSVAMQGTVREHAESPHASEACASCHMPLVAGGAHGKRRSHGFSVFGRPEMLARAVTVEATRAGSSAVTLKLRATGAGHAVPTGDMFRRLELFAFAEVDEKTIAATPAVLGRRFAQIPSKQGSNVTPLHVPVGDDRVPASGAPREALLPFATPIDDVTVHWEVVYARMSPEMAARFGVDLRSERIVVAKGELLPISKKGSR